MDYINIVCYTNSIRVNSDFIKYYCSDLHLQTEIRKDNIIKVETDIYYEVLARYNLYIREKHNTSDKGWFVVTNITDSCLNTWRFNTFREAQEKQSDLQQEGHAVSMFFGYTF